MERTRRHGRRQPTLIAIGAVALIALVVGTSTATAPPVAAEDTIDVHGTITYVIADLHLDHDGAIDLDEHESAHLFHHEADDDHRSDRDHSEDGHSDIEHGDRSVVLERGPELAPLLLDLEEIAHELSPGDEIMLTTTTASLDDAEALDEPVDVLDIQPAASTSSEMGVASATTGGRSVLVIPVKYPGESAQWSTPHLNAVMGQVTSWFDTTSRGQVELTYELNPYVTITNIGCNNYGFDAHTAAVVASGRNVASFDHVLVDLPTSTNCPSGMAGAAYMPGSRIVTVGSQGFTMGTITHEVGHNLGLDHSEWAWCWDGDTALVLASRANEATQCGYITYVDPDTVMGHSRFHQPFSGVELQELGWLHDDEILELADGSVTLHDLTSATPGPRLAVVTAPDGGIYTLEFRSSASHSWWGSTSPGVVIRYTPTGVLPRLRLDMTPGSHGTTREVLYVENLLDASLRADSPAWIDPTGTVRIEVTAQGPSSATVQIDDLSTADASKYVPVAPSRILDTRPDRGIGTVTGAIAPNGTITVPVTGLGGIPEDGVSAVTLNVTATGSQRDGYVTVFPSGVTRPLASAINLTSARQTRANQVTVPVGVDGNISMFTTAGGHMIADVAGYYTEVNSSADGRLVPIGPERILDTRPGTPAPGPVGSPKTKPLAGATIDVQVAGVGGVPASGADAVVMNVTATAATAPGYVTVWPRGIAQPTASSINLDAAGATVANLVTVPIGTEGRVRMFTSAGTHLLADVVGYITAEDGLTTRSGLFRPTTPTRWFDTRIPPSDMPSWMGPEYTRCPPGCTDVEFLTGQQPVPMDAAAVLVNTTSTRPHHAGHVTVYPGDQVRPLSSNLNLSGSNDVRANAVVGKLGDGALAFHLSAGGYVIGDIGGYWLR